MILNGKASEKMRERKRTIFCAVALSLTGILTGWQGNVLASEQQEETDIPFTEQGVLSDESGSTEVIGEEEILEEDILVSETMESEIEIVFEPEYQPEKDTSPVRKNMKVFPEQIYREPVTPVELSDPQRIAIDGEKATCLSYASIQYGYQPEVKTGTIRYISQIEGSGLFDWNYWGNWGYQAGIECGTASISMAMSYIGINLTPQQILDAHGGFTIFKGWGVQDLSPDVESGVNQYISGRGQYSPVIVHLPYYSDLGHYVLLIGKLSGTEYLVLDCAQNTTWAMSVYSDFYASIDEVYQYYNPESPLLDHVEKQDAPVMATCTKLGWTGGTHCQVCGEVLQKQEAVPCNGHVWTEWKVNVKPEKGKKGEKMRFCQVCGKKDSRAIEALPQEFRIEIPESCVSGGL